MEQEARKPEVSHLVAGKEKGPRQNRRGQVAWGEVSEQ